MMHTVFEAYESPEQAGISSKGLAAFLDAAEKAKDKVQFHSMILLRHGKQVCRWNWAPYDDQTPHLLYSLSKSFTSAAAGFAVAEGLLRWDSPVTKILPEEVPAENREALGQVTLETLLSMGSGLDEASDSPSPDPKITWARHVLSHQVKYPPMTHFHYNTFGTYLVSCMVQKVAGMTIRDYLMPRLFEPLGIEKPDWDLSPEGICCGGFGLHLTSESIARFGQCLLQKGVWQGRQVLPKGWVELATREHIANYDGARQAGNEWGQGYGFQFWRCIDGRYRGDGAFGQVCMVDEARDAVLAVTCGTSDMGAEFALIREHLFTAFDMEPGTEAEQVALTAKAAQLHYALSNDDDGTPVQLPEGTFRTEYEGYPVYLRLSGFAFDLIRMELRFGDQARDAFEFYLPRGRMALVGVNPWQKTRFFGGYAWHDQQLKLHLRTVDGPDTMEGSLSWTDKQIVYDGIGIGCPGGHVVFEKM